MEERAVPPRVVTAERVASEAGFKKSCIREVGRLLKLAAAAKPDGAIAESGTGSGVGTAWLHSGLGTGARLFTVERDEELARRAVGVFADDQRVSVLTGTGSCLSSTPRSTSSSAMAGASVTTLSESSSSWLPVASSSWTTSLPRPIGRLVSRVKWMNSACSTSLIRTWTPPRY